MKEKYNKELYTKEKEKERRAVCLLHPGTDNKWTFEKKKKKGKRKRRKERERRKKWARGERGREEEIKSNVRKKNDKIHGRERKV